MGMNYELSPEQEQFVREANEKSRLAREEREAKRIQRAEKLEGRKAEYAGHPRPAEGDSTNAWLRHERQVQCRACRAWRRSPMLSWTAAGVILKETMRRGTGGVH